MYLSCQALPYSLLGMSELFTWMCQCADCICHLFSTNTHSAHWLNWTHPPTSNIIVDDCSLFELTSVTTQTPFTISLGCMSNIIHPSWNDVKVLLSTASEILMSNGNRKEGRCHSFFPQEPNFKGLKYRGCTYKSSLLMSEWSNYLFWVWDGQQWAVQKLCNSFTVSFDRKWVHGPLKEECPVVCHLKIYLKEIRGFPLASERHYWWPYKICSL